MISLVRIVAVLILGLLVLDLGDAWCDPLIAPGAGPLISTTATSSTDPCSGTCVPDCFCCSSSVPAVSLHLTCEPLTSMLALHVTEAAASSGFEIPLDHVPLVS
jgi:hypothetical protein